MTLQGGAARRGSRVSDACDDLLRVTVMAQLVEG